MIVRLWVSLILSVTIPSVTASPLSSERQIVETVKFCDIAQNPEDFSGRIVAFTAYAVGFRHGINLHGCNCSGVIALEFPVGPLADASIRLVEDESFHQLEHALNDLVPGSRRPTSIAVATFVGRVDHIFVIRKGKRVRVASGYGFMSAAPTRLLLEMVTDIKLSPANKALNPCDFR